MPSALNHRFTRSLVGEEALEFLRNRYFLLGLALQKGTPVLILPLTIAAVGIHVYADYVLLFSLVQVASVIGSLSIPQALIPFWYGHAEKGVFVATLLAVMMGAQLLISIPLGIALALGTVGLTKISLVFVPIILVFAAVYSLNSIALNLVRVQLNQLVFFWSTFFTAGLLTALVVLLKYGRGPKLLMYSIINILVIGLQSWLYFRYSRLTLKSILRSALLGAFARQILRFSVPLTIYTLVTLLALVVDKWIVKFFFSQTVFSQYVVDFQFAFSVTLLSVVIGMYNSQKQCDLVQRGESAALRRNVVGNYALSLIGSFGAALGAFAYAHFGRVHLSMGYWALALSFTLNNCYAVNSSLLTAQKRSRIIAVIGALSTFTFIIVLVLSALIRMIGFIYAAYIGYQVMLFVLSALSIAAVLRHKEGRQAFSHA